MKLLLGSIRAVAASTEILLTMVVLVKQSCINAVNFHVSVCGSNPVKESTGRIIKPVSKVRPKRLSAAFSPAAIRCADVYLQCN